MTEEKSEEYDHLFKSLGQYYKEKMKNSEKPDPEIAKLAKELTDKIKKKKLKSSMETWFNLICILLLIIGLLMLFWDQAELHILFLLRFCVVQLAPIVDFTEIFSKDQCILGNPSYAPENRITDQMCQNACHKNNENVFLQEFANNVNLNKSMFNELVFELDIPIIETTEISLWKLQNTETLLNSFYNELKNLNGNEFCLFQSTKNLKSPIDLFNRFKSKKPKSYFAMWENCGKKSSKLVKRLIKRPSFFPKTMEFLQNSWLFISKGIATKDHQPLPIMNRLVLYSQIKGESELILTPVEQCAAGCEQQIVHLVEGQIAIVSDLWIVDFKTAMDIENVVLVLMAQ